MERSLSESRCGDAAILPVTEEAHGQVEKIQLRPRLTPHVRHLAKYIDMPVSDTHAFVFWRNGTLTDERSRTLHEFVHVIEQGPTKDFDKHLRRNDFSRWIAGVFGDYALSNSVRTIEDNYATVCGSDVVQDIAREIRARYEFVQGHS